MPRTKKSLAPLTIERINWLIGQLQKHPHRYDQGQFCGTQACLAGFILPKALNRSRFITFTTYDQMYKQAGVEDTQNLSLCGTAGEWLGITREQVNKLFGAYWVGEAAKFNRDCYDTHRVAADKAIQRLELFISSDGRI